MNKLILLPILLMFGFWGKTIIAQEVQGELIETTQNITVVKVWGTHEERGYAYGYLIGDKFADMYNNYIMPAFGASNLSFARTVISQGGVFEIDSAYIREAQAIIAGATAGGHNVAGFDYVDILLANTYLDLQALPTFKNVNIEAGCSSFMNWNDATQSSSLQGKSVISRHVDWSENQTLINNQVMVVHIPEEEDEQPWLLIGFAGQIAALSGVNSSGLGIFQHNLSDFTGSIQSIQTYEPIWFSLRRALETVDPDGNNVSNTQDLRYILNQNTYGYTDGFIVTCLASSTVNTEDSLIAMVAELTPHLPTHVYRSTEYDDDIPGDNLYAANYEIKRNEHNHYCSRYNNVVANMGTGTGIGIEENWHVMKNFSTGSNGNIQFMQFVPDLNILNLSIYENQHQAYQNDSVRYDLNVLFDVPANMEKVIEDEISLKAYTTDAGLIIDFKNLFTGSIYVTDILGRTVSAGNYNSQRKVKMDIDIQSQYVFVNVLSKTGNAKTIKCFVE